MGAGNEWNTAAIYRISNLYMDSGAGYRKGQS
jgi:hypothetical protein